TRPSASAILGWCTSSRGSSPSSDAMTSPNCSERRPSSRRILSSYLRSVWSLKASGSSRVGRSCHRVISGPNARLSGGNSAWTRRTHPLTCTEVVELGSEQRLLVRAPSGGHGPGAARHERRSLTCPLASASSRRSLGLGELQRTEVRHISGCGMAEHPHTVQRSRPGLTRRQFVRRDDEGRPPNG